MKNNQFIQAIKRVRNQMTRPRTFEGHNKVFCLGWLKTGTTSFGDAMRRLGFKHCGWDEEAYAWYKAGRLEKLIQFAEHFESFDDLPWNQADLLSSLDKAYPSSKYILLERDPESWYSSYLQHTRERGYSPAPERESSIREFLEHQTFIKEYFRASAPHQLLVMNVIDGQGYETLCPFLGVPVLNEPFPHSNPTKHS